MEAWGRFTARGGRAVEEQITQTMREVRTQLKRALEYGSYRAVLLIGGYGRGEGGVDRSRVDHSRVDRSVVGPGQGEGKERPHNNFDILIIAERTPQDLKERAERALNGIDSGQVAFDVGVIARRQLEASPALVMWYDMRHGHKHLLGDSTYVPSLSQFRLENVPAWDVRNLLVNRGSLLIINERLLERESPSERDQRTVIKHGIKAVIGYGDALLYFHDRYDWSYREKQKRMQANDRVSEPFRALYDEAMEFRFEPDYDAYLARDLVDWNRNLRQQLADVHLRCEGLRLGVPDLTWKDYPRVAFMQRLTEDPTSLRAVAKKAIALRQPQGVAAITGQRAKLGYMVSRPRERLPIIFPAAAYEEMPTELVSAAKATLRTQESSPSALQRAYLKAWGQHVDSNFESVLRALHIAL